MPPFSIDGMVPLLVRLLSSVGQRWIGKLKRSPSLGQIRDELHDGPKENDQDKRAAKRNEQETKVIVMEDGEDVSHS